MGRPHHGRGALSNPTGRFEAETRTHFDDEWDLATEDSAKLTELIPERARSIITHNDSPDIPFEQSINPYRGCEHGCIYCYARPNHHYINLSSGLDFETKILFKENAVELLRKALSKKAYRVRPIAIGASTDPWQPAERKLKLTRGLLELALETRHPIMLVTKSDLPLRDIDILSQLAALHLVHINLSVTTLQPELAQKMEPRAAAPQKRLDAMDALARAGIPVGVLAAPMIPGLNDHELEAILEASHNAGATVAGTLALRLPLDVQELFVQWLTEHYPDRKDKVLSLQRQANFGALDESRFGLRMEGTGPRAELLQLRMSRARERYGFKDAPPLRSDLFVPPRGSGVQLKLF